MRITKISRPWIKEDNGHRHNHRVKDPFYQSSAWRRTRNAFIAANPKCIVCGGVATVADHKVRRAEGGSDLDWSNLQGLCKKCHDSKDNNAGRK